MISGFSGRSKKNPKNGVCGMGAATQWAAGAAVSSGGKTRGSFKPLRHSTIETRKRSSKNWRSKLILWGREWDQLHIPCSGERGDPGKSKASTPYEIYKMRLSGKPQLMFKKKR